VTFSDPGVAEFVNEHFVAAWHNRGAGFHNEDYAAEQWIFGSSMEAYPTKNICTFFLTPEGRVFHYVAGFWAPEIFRVELETALSLRREAFDAGMELKRGGLEALRRVHEEAASTIRSRVAALSIAPRSYRGSAHEHSDSCRAAVEAGGRHLAGLHRHWSGAAELPEFEEVRYDYLFGNSFTEEPRGGAAPRVSGKIVGGE
jgi:hypothetical protein